MGNLQVDDKYLVEIGVFAVGLSILMTLLLGAVLPDLENGNYENIYERQQEIGRFTGESARTIIPWQLEGIYEPWNTAIPDAYSQDRIGLDGSLHGNDVTLDWVYLDENNQTHIDYFNSTHQNVGLGNNSIYNQKNGLFLGSLVALNPLQKSVSHLGDSYDVVTITQQKSGMWQGFLHWLNDSWGIERTTVNMNYWQYTGWSYVFTPMLPLQIEDPDDVNDNGFYNAVTQRATLTVIWYAVQNDERIEGGLRVYAGKEDGLVEIGQVTLEDIIREQQSLNTDTSSKFMFSFNSATIYLNIKFDTMVIGSADYTNAFTTGQWKIALTSPYVGSYLNVDDDYNMGLTLGSIVDMFTKILTFNVPNLPAPWDLAVWLIVVLPISILLALLIAKLATSILPG